MQHNLFANGWHVAIAIKAKMAFIVITTYTQKYGKKGKIEKLLNFHYSFRYSLEI